MSRDSDWRELGWGTSSCHEALVSCERLIELFGITIDSCCRVSEGARDTPFKEDAKALSDAAIELCRRIMNNRSGLMNFERDHLKEFQP